MQEKKELPKISIITPSFNQAEYIEQTIRSVVEQGYPNLEYLIMDGGSVDNSLKIIKKYAKKYPKIIKWVSEKDGGQVDAINKGLKKATGEIVAYINSDDGYMPKTFFTVARGFADQPGKKWLIGRCKIKDSKKSAFFPLISSYINFWQTHYNFAVHCILNFAPQPSVFWKKSVIRSVGMFNKKYSLAFDYDYWLRLGRLGKPVILQKTLSFFRIHKHSKSSMYYKQQFDEEFAIAKKNTRNILINLLHWAHINLLVIPLYSLNK